MILTVPSLLLNRKIGCEGILIRCKIFFSGVPARFLSRLLVVLSSMRIKPGGGVTPVGAMSRAATMVKIFDRRKMALTA